LTHEDINEYVNQAESNISKTLNHLISLPNDQRTTENMMKPWNRLANELLVNFNVLNFITKMDLPIKTEAAQAMHALQTFVFKALLRNPALYRSFIAYMKMAAEKEGSLNPYERYQVYNVLQSYEHIKNAFSKEEQEELAHLKALFANGNMQPFIYLEGKSQDNTYSQDNEAFTILTLNTCFMPGEFPFLYGGVILPWQKRVKPLAEKILSANADVVCLQEVFPEEASYALYEALKNHYIYFYAAIGPRPLGFSINTIGLPSGLFVASKYPIEQPCFTLFSAVEFPINYGFFDFIVKNGKVTLGHVYTTHMHAFNQELFVHIRTLQLKQILDKMQADLKTQKETMPFFLCGDLNVPYGSQEPSEALIHACFYDGYNKNITTVNESTSTCTDYFSNYYFSFHQDSKQIDPNFQILDYALLLKSLPSSPHHQLLCQEVQLNTELISMNDLRDPEGAISDHHALLTTIKLKK